MLERAACRRWGASHGGGGGALRQPGAGGIHAPQRVQGQAGIVIPWGWRRACFCVHPFSWHRRNTVNEVGAISAYRISPNYKHGVK